MKFPSSYLNKFDKRAEKKSSVPRSPWEEQIDRFYFRMKQEIDRPYIGKLLSGIGIHDAGAAHVFYAKLEREAKNFTGLFNHLTGNVRKKKA
jgi:hypothetical protein